MHFVFTQVNDEKVEGLMKNEALSCALQTLPVAHNKAKENILRVQDKVKKRRSDMGTEDHFAVGDKVLKRNVRQEQRKGGKMESGMLGPFTIVKLEGKTAHLVSKKGKSVTKYNIDQLAPYNEPEARIPRKWPRIASPACPQERTPEPPQLSPPSSSSTVVSLPTQALSQTVKASHCLESCEYQFGFYK